MRDAEDVLSLADGGAERHVLLLGLPGLLPSGLHKQTQHRTIPRWLSTGIKPTLSYRERTRDEALPWLRLLARGGGGGGGGEREEEEEARVWSGTRWGRVEEWAR